MADPSKIRNVAIIAHIDHGKTTLIDSIFSATHTFRDNARVDERVMDSNDLEKERGITITAKNCTVLWKDLVINVVDTPGHADFSGEVERVLSMVDSVLLLVDANEGPMPQTRYVTQRALALGLKPVVVINKVDRPSARPEDALMKTFDLFIELGATDEQADFPVVYGSGLDGWIVKNLGDERRGMDPLFEVIDSHVPPPKVDLTAPFRMQVSALDWSEYIGRIACGRVMSGTYRLGGHLLRTTVRWSGGHDRHDDKFEIVRQTAERTAHLWVTRGLDRVAVEEVAAGDIVWLAGPEEINLGDIFSSPDFDHPELHPLEIEEPTVSMFFLVNSGPFAGQDGKPVTLRQIKERLERETRVNIALRMEDIGRADGVKVSGRGELHLGILIENMRREGMEICVSRPEVITRHGENGELLEPLETCQIDVPDEYIGGTIEALARRKGELKNMESNRAGLTRMTFNVPTRGLIGFRNEFLTDTRGLGILASRFTGYGPWAGEITTRLRGSMVATETGDAAPYSLETLQVRGQLFVGPGDRVYAGMIVGEASRDENMPCNPTKRKALGNYRSSTKEATTVLDTPRRLTLDQAIEWIGEDELVEVTPKTVRVRKSVLDAEERKKAERKREIANEALAAAKK